MQAQTTDHGGADDGRRPNAIDAHVGARIRLLRRLAGFSQEALARQLGVTFQQLQKYESGINRIGAGRLFEIARALRAEVADLYTDLEVATARAPEADEAPKAEHEIMAAAATPDGLRLIRAFGRIGDPRRRAALVEMAAALGDPAEPTGSPCA